MSWGSVRGRSNKFCLGVHNDCIPCVMEIFFGSWEPTRDIDMLWHDDLSVTYLTLFWSHFEQVKSTDQEFCFLEGNAWYFEAVLRSRGECPAPENQHGECQEEPKGRHKVLLSLRVCLAVTVRAIRIVHRVNALRPRSITCWYCQFQTGNHSVDDLPHSGRPSVLPANVLNNIHTAISQNPNISMTALANQIGISHGTVHKAMTKTLCMKKRPAHWVHLTLPQQV